VTKELSGRMYRINRGNSHGSNIFDVIFGMNTKKELEETIIARICNDIEREN
jgi:hypothetical protein